MRIREILPFAACCILLSACGGSIVQPPVQEETKPVSCFEELGFHGQLAYEPGEWNYEPVPTTNWLACLPENKDMYGAEPYDKEFGVKMNAFRKYPSWETNFYGTLTIPSSKSPEWNIINENNSGGMNIFLVPIPEEWDGSVQDWVNEKLGGKLYKNSDHCATSTRKRGVYKTMKDYPSPHYVEFQTPVIHLKHADGEAVRFEACLEIGSWYAVLLKGRVTLIGYGMVFSKENEVGEELLQKILENLRVNEAGV